MGTSHLLLYPQDQLCEQDKWDAEVQGCGACRDAGMKECRDTEMWRFKLFVRYGGHRDVGDVGKWGCRDAGMGGMKGCRDTQMQRCRDV